MDMFVINRYPATKSCEDHSAKERENLQKLMSKIEERRKQKKIIDNTLQSEPHSATEGSTTKNEVVVLNKKRKLPDSNNTFVNGSKDKETAHGELNVLSTMQTDVSFKGSGSAPSEKETARGGGGHEELFTVLGSDSFAKKQKVKRVLPSWLANPSVVSVNLKELDTAVDDIDGLAEDIVAKLKEKGITHLFPVQAQVIPWLLCCASRPAVYWPSDICVSAPTGSGKTLAFVLPIVQILRKRVIPCIRALVVLPVQDLAAQVFRVFKAYCSVVDLKVALITGQNSFIKEQQQLINTNPIFGPQSLVDIIVTTPGRLVDHLKSTPNFSLKHLRFLVIDEADRVMDCVQNDWLHYVNKNIYGGGEHPLPPPLTPAALTAMPPPPHKLLFSATLSQDPEKLQHFGLFQPKLFTSVVSREAVADKPPAGVQGEFIGKYTTPAELKEKFCVATPESKPLVLYYLILKHKWKHVLCFADSQEAAHRLCLLLKHLSQGKLVSAQVSSVLRRQERDEVIRKFTNSQIDILVSTDALARGMDIPNVKYVVSYDLPKYIKNYIHRIGRTGRAGKSGKAITLLLQNQVSTFHNLLKSAGKNTVGELIVSEETLLPFEEAYKSALDRLKHDLQSEQRTLIRRLKQKKTKKITSAEKKRMTKYRQIKVMSTKK